MTMRGVHRVLNARDEDIVPLIVGHGIQELNILLTLRNSCGYGSENIFNAIFTRM